MSKSCTSAWPRWLAHLTVCIVGLGQDGESPLWIASAYGFSEVVNALLQHKRVDINLADPVRVEAVSERISQESNSALWQDSHRSTKMREFGSFGTSSDHPHGRGWVFTPMGSCASSCDALAKLVCPDCNATNVTARLPSCFD